MRENDYVCGEKTNANLQNIPQNSIHNMTKKLYSISNTVLILISVILIFQLFRDSMSSGDFIGYVNAGNAVLSKQNIYADYLNTWPPLFSVFSVILAIGDKLSSFFIRFIWLVGSIISLYYIISITVEIFFKKPLDLRANGNGIMIQEPIIIVPLLISLRFIMDNLANVQINIYMLLGSLLCILCFIQKKYAWFGILLALTISLKVYTIFILFYFLYKREFKPVIWTILFLALLNAISFLVFGFDQAVEYYQHWMMEVAPKSFVADHKNQSIFGAFLRFFTSEDPDHNMYVNVLSLAPHLTKQITYIAVVIAAIFPGILLRKKMKDTSSLSSFLGYSLILTVIPVLSPVSWKPYFIFLWFPYFILTVLLFHMNSQLHKSTLKLLRYLFGVSVLLNVFTTELFIGGTFSDWTEAYSAITFGTIILLVIQIVIIINIEKFDLKNVIFKSSAHTTKSEQTSL